MISAEKANCCFKTDGFVDARRFTPEAVAMMLKEHVELLARQG
jgi:hypothetical protein